MDKKIILFDTDIGTDIDDALALIFLTTQTKNRLIGVSTVYGPVLTRVQATKTLLKALNKKIPIIQGHSQTLSKRKIWLSGHEKEMVNLNLQPDFQSLENFLNQIKQKIIIVTTGPLTNIAILQTKGSLEKHCQHLFIMGGVLSEKNLPKTEHNFSADPKATNLVFSSKVPITIIPLNLTLKFPLSKIQLISLSKIKSSAGKLISHWLESWSNTTKTFPKISPLFNKVFLHDPLAAAITCNFPCKTHKLNVKVSPRTGKLMLNSKGKNINFVTDVSLNTVSNIFQIIKNAL